MADIELGAESMFNGRWQHDSPATKTGLTIYEWLNTNGAVLRLPPLSLNTRPLWFEIGWQRFLFETKGRPDKIPYIAQLGRSAEGKKSTSRGMSEQTAAMRVQDVKAKIKELVKKSFFTIIKPIPHQMPPLE